MGTLIHSFRSQSKQCVFHLNQNNLILSACRIFPSSTTSTAPASNTNTDVKFFSTLNANKPKLVVSPVTYPTFYLQSRGLADKKEVTSKVEEFRKGKFDTIPDPTGISHFKTNQTVSSSHSAESVDEVEKKNVTLKKTKEEDDDEDDFIRGMPPIGEIVLPHPIWSEKQVNNVKVTHKEPDGFVDRMAFGTVKIFRGGFDVFSGFLFGERNERKWLNRISFLETVAGVPGMVAAMLRHMKSLRRMQRDQGWIHTLLEEAENERMHLMTALQLKKPSLFFRFCVIGSQGVFVTLFGACYLVSPRFCHRFVGYLEEEAVITYTKLLHDIDNGPMSHWKTQPAPDVAVLYWKLDSDATMRDVILAIRADEAHHRVVNHSLASLKKDEFNPYKPGK